MPLLHLLIKRVEGLDNIPKKGPFIIAANHMSFIDIFVILSAFKRRAKRRKCYVISAMFFALDFLTTTLFSEFGGSIRLKRGVRGSYIKPAIRKLEGGHMVCIFPEGIPSRKKKLMRGKTGVARLVLNGRVPVVPVGIKGTREIWSKERPFPKLRRRITIKIGAPLNFNKYSKKRDDYETLEHVTTNIMEHIADLLGAKYSYTKHH
jgi:1-acyl-sn-glycerol-3-phosphate acyltransferase|tara:strand:+ start:2209 stop:2826 length:618 start_codon:yes stop_codon:yes gene_type:complete